MTELRLSEREFQKRVTDLCDWLNLRWYHSHDSRRDPAGFPDLVIVGPGGVVFAELKSAKGRIRAEQTQWQADLVRAGAEAHIWRPDDWPEIQRRLKAISVRHNVA